MTGAQFRTLPRLGNVAPVPEFQVDRGQLQEIVQRVRDGRLRTNIGAITTLDDAVAAINATERHKAKIVVRVRP